jgi:glycosyltransferase involved in cell wall biosynthesis
MRILHYLRHLGLGGTEKTCQLFAEHSSKDIDVAIVCERSGTHDRLEQFQKAMMVAGGTIFMVDSYKNGEPDGTELQRVIDEWHPNIFHVYRSGYQEFPEPGMDINVPGFVETNVFGQYDPNALIDRTLFMSKWLMDKTMRHLAPISRGLNPRRFDYVNNPVEMPCSCDILPIVERWGNDCIVLGRVGRPDNGIYNAVSVEAARLLRLQGYDVRFVVVAPPSNMVDDLARYDIPFYAIEPTTDPMILSTAYNSMNIYAHARADGETFGVNIAEAMIHNLPVVTHIATPSFPGMGVFQSQTELVDNGVTGIIVQNDPVEYADALKTLIDNAEDRFDMGNAGFDKACKEYHVNACVSKLENIYRDIVNE